jgi:hypothetical protein
MRIIALITFLTLLQLATAQTIKKWYNLSSPLTEISGMTLWQNRYFAHGDGGSPAMIFELDAKGKIIDTTTLLQPNTDWEDMAANTTHFFIGDFGNNNGNRKDLKILKFAADSLGKKKVVPEVISFSYADQTDFTSSQFTNFDCEAMVATADSLYLFSKSKASGICRVYALPVISGNYVADISDTVQPPFWVTGSHLQNNELILCGYVPNIMFSLTPLFYQCKMVNGRIQHGSGKAYNLTYTGTKQIETVCRSTTGSILLSGEAYSGDSAAVFELILPAAKTNRTKTQGHGLIPNPAGDKIQLKNNLPGSYCGIYKPDGQLVKNLTPNIYGEMNIAQLPGGLYWIEYVDDRGKKVFERLLKL